MTAIRLTPARRTLIAAVHAAAKAHGLDEETRRDKIALVTDGKRSSSDCTDAQLRQVLDAINGAGRPSGRKRADTPTARKARALWLSLHALGLVEDPSESALRAWVKRQHHVDDLAFVRASDAGAVIDGLKQWARRAKVDWSEYKDPRRCVASAQWRLLMVAGAAPAADLSSHCYAVAGAASVAFASPDKLDKLINDLGARVRALRRLKGAFE